MRRKRGPDRFLIGLYATIIAMAFVCVASAAAYTMYVGRPKPTVFVDLVIWRVPYEAPEDREFSI